MTEINRKTAEMLGLDKKAISTIFAHAAEKYNSPVKKQPLTGVAREFFEVLFMEEHTTMREFEEHRRTMAGRSAATVTRAITTLQERGLPVQREQVTDNKGITPIQYTRYYLTPEFKMSLAEEARKATEISAPDKSTISNAPRLTRTQF